MKPAIIDTDTTSYFFRNNANVVAKLDEYLQEYGLGYLSVVLIPIETKLRVVGRNPTVRESGNIPPLLTRGLLPTTHHPL